MTTRKEDLRQSKIQKLNQCISDLVYDKEKIRKAYNYYHGKMDTDQYKHLEENYGIGTPSQIRFIPLIKKHIDALVGKFLDLPLNVQVSCKDERTLSNIFREKQLRLNQEVFNTYLNDLNNQIMSVFNDKGEVKDPITEQKINQLKEDLDKNFISEYEIAAQNIIKYFSQSRNIDLRLKARLAMTDLLIAGTVYYREYPTPNKNNIELELLSTINTFVEKNPNSYYLKDSRRAVCRYYMTPEQILHKYNNELSEENKKELREGLLRHGQIDGQSYIIRSSGPINAVTNDDTENGTGLLGGLEASPTWDNNYGMYSTGRNEVTVCEVEWIEVDDDGVEHRCSGARIGEDIYIIREDDINVVRSVDDPKHCSLSINGIFMTTRHNQPFSLVLATADLQD